MMILDTRIIADGHTTLSGKTDLESVKADLPEFAQPINYRAEIDRSGPTIFVHVWFDGLFRLECSRCLKSIDAAVDAEFRITLKEQAGKFGAAFDDEDAVDFYYDTRHELVDISSAFYDEIMTEIPLMPLCSEACEGIDVSKMGNLSVEYKDVVKTTKEIDPRWDALKKLKKD